MPAQHLALDASVGQPSRWRFACITPVELSFTTQSLPAQGVCKAAHHLCPSSSWKWKGSMVPPLDAYRQKKVCIAAMQGVEPQFEH